MCLKKNDLSWGACEELPPFLDRLAASHAARSTAIGASSTETRLVFRAIFAQDDIMTGKGGQEYYRKCWSEPSLKPGIAFDSLVVPGTNHDNVGLPAQGQFRKELDMIRKRALDPHE